MAQTGYTPISIYYSSTASAAPTAGNLVAGELAINTADGKLFYKDSAGVVQVIGTKGGVGSSTTTQVLYNSSGLVVGSSNFIFDGTNLGVGGTPAQKFNVIQGTKATTASVITSAGFTTTDASAFGLYFRQKTDATAANRWMGIASFDNGVGAANLILQDLGGNVGVGTTSPQSLFHVSGSVATPVIAQSSGSAVYSQFTNSGGSAYVGSSGNALQFLVNAAGNEAGRFNSNYNLVLAGGTTSASGVGVTFPATQSASSDANCLDDYEEGTWTATITATSTNPTVSYAYQTCSYTKIGNTVSVFVRIQTTSISGGSGTALISGLPFAVSGSYRNGAAIGYFSYVNLDAGYSQFGLSPDASSTSMRFVQSGDNNSANIVTIGNVGNAFDTLFTFTYQI